MNIYKELSENQIKLLEETGGKIENKEYSDTEIRQLQDLIATHIFSQSKKEFRKEVNKYSEILRIIGD